MPPGAKLLLESKQYTMSILTVNLQFLELQSALDNQ